ncbi:M20 aminoacylase family protein [Aestuariivirga sp.]|uniref:M20 aminoacylase family protein n=1 Tax=Aestuariivirga sp. TaxID=2650926 RepID=UPI0025C2AC96|nr:M20 aminoacylase family protein [Aestuariivirga sp.]MCA3555512.1 amidohydrolase [Aestuariivirga sp.]
MIEDVLIRHLPGLTAIRHDLHAHPEMLFQEERTARIVADECRRLGFDVTTGIARTGVVASLTNGASGRVIGIRADMDALPIQEQTNLPYASKYPGKMHACGHDGHTTMLLGLARYLSEHRHFDGTVRLIFQPSEEDEGGAFRMIEDGLFTRFPCDRIFALHNLPGEPEGQIMVRPGPITACCDVFTIVVRGVGGHGALPHKSVDPVVAASSIVLALQTVVSRNLDPHDPAVITVGAINGGSMATVIPEEVRLLVGVRTVTRPVRDLILTRIGDVAAAQAKSFGCTADVQIGLDSWSYPAGFNTADEAALVRAVALDMGQDPAHIDMRGPFMFSEDFSAMQEVAPSCYFGLGAGPGPMLHDPGYDFNDALLVKGSAFWARLVEKALPQA